MMKKPVNVLNNIPRDARSQETIQPDERRVEIIAPDNNQLLIE